jgi:hypothetical protein
LREHTFEVRWHTRILLVRRARYEQRSWSDYVRSKKHHNVRPGDLLSKRSVKPRFNAGPYWLA